MTAHLIRCNDTARRRANIGVMSDTKTALVTGANKGLGYEIAAGLGATGLPRGGGGPRQGPGRGGREDAARRRGGRVRGPAGRHQRPERHRGRGTDRTPGRTPGRSRQQRRHLGRDRDRSNWPFMICLAQLHYTWSRVPSHASSAQKRLANGITSSSVFFFCLRDYYLTHSIAITGV